MPMTTREVHFRVRNLNSDDYERLRCFAKAETGKASVSLLARRLLLKELALKNHEIKAQIAQHTEKVGKLVSTNFERMP